MLRKLYKIMRKKFIPMSQYPDYLRKSGMKIGDLSDPASVRHKSATRSGRKHYLS